MPIEVSVRDSGGGPENSMTAFQAALDMGYGIELDVHLMKDGKLAVIHDSSLERTTGQMGYVEDLTARDLKNYALEDTDQTIPEFGEVLKLVAGKVPLIVELKPVRGNYKQLTEAACEMLENYPGAYFLESFDTRCLIWLRKNRPEVIRGQLSRYYPVSKFSKDDIVKFFVRSNLLNFLGYPDLIVYHFQGRKKTISNMLCRKIWKAQLVSWTVWSRKDYDAAVKEGWIPIFEYFLP